MIWCSLSFFTTLVCYIIGKRLRILTLIMLLCSGAHKGGNVLQQLYASDPSIDPSTVPAVQTIATNGVVLGEKG